MRFASLNYTHINLITNCLTACPTVNPFSRTFQRTTTMLVKVFVFGSRPKEESYDHLKPPEHGLGINMRKNLNYTYKSK